MKLKLNEKIKSLYELVKQSISETEIDWEQITEKDNSKSFNGCIDNLKFQVKPNNVSVSITKEDEEGLMEVTREIPQINKKAASILYKELCERFGTNDDINFFKEVHQILETHNQRIYEEKIGQDDEQNMQQTTYDN